jgi:hypothetical protein
MTARHTELRRARNRRALRRDVGQRAGECSIAAPLRAGRSAPAPNTCSDESGSRSRSRTMLRSPSRTLPDRVGDGGLPPDAVGRIQRLGAQWARWDESRARWAVDEARARIVCAGSTMRPGRRAVYPPSGAGPGLPGSKDHRGGCRSGSFPMSWPTGSSSGPSGMSTATGRRAAPGGVAVWLHSEADLEVAKRLTKVALDSADR